MLGLAPGVTVNFNRVAIADSIWDSSQDVFISKPPSSTALKTATPAIAGRRQERVGALMPSAGRRNVLSNQSDAGEKPTADPFRETYNVIDARH